MEVFGGLQITIPSTGSKLPLAYNNKSPILVYNNKPPILVWGGSSSVGAYAIQARLSGYQVIATASKSNHPSVKSLGADVGSTAA